MKRGRAIGLTLAVLFVTVLSVCAGEKSYSLKTIQRTALPLDAEIPVSYRILGTWQGNLYCFVRYGSLQKLDDTAKLLAIRMGDGQVVHEKMLRVGQGPGEFQDISSGVVDTTNGDVILYDSASKRFTIFDAALSRPKAVKSDIKGSRYLIGASDGLLFCVGRYYRDNRLHILQVYQQDQWKPIEHPLIPISSDYPLYMPMDYATVSSGSNGCYYFIFPLQEILYRIHPENWEVEQIPYQTDRPSRYEELPLVKDGYLDMGPVTEWLQHIGTRHQNVIPFRGHFLIFNTGPEQTAFLDVVSDEGKVLDRIQLPKRTRSMFCEGNRLFLVKRIKLKETDDWTTVVDEVELIAQ